MGYYSVKLHMWTAIIMYTKSQNIEDNTMHAIRFIVIFSQHPNINTFLDVLRNMQNYTDI